MRRYSEGSRPETNPPPSQIIFLHFIKKKTLITSYTKITYNNRSILSNHLSDVSRCILQEFLKFFTLFASFRYFSVEFHFIGPVALMVFRAKFVLKLGISYYESQLSAWRVWYLCKLFCCLKYIFLKDIWQFIIEFFIHECAHF